jgi:hypothetical protein
MIRRRAAGAGIKTLVGNHTFRATGVSLDEVERISI